jgi:hypothetical protein
MLHGESRPIRMVKLDGRLWLASLQGVTAGNFNPPLPSIVDGAEARQRGFRTAMVTHGLCRRNVSNAWCVQTMWNRVIRRARVTGGTHKDYVLVPSYLSMSPREVYGTLRIDCLTLMSTKACDDKLGSQQEGGEVVWYDFLAQACSAQLSRYVFTFNRGRHNHMISLVPAKQPGAC